MSWFLENTNTPSRNEPGCELGKLGILLQIEKDAQNDQVQGDETEQEDNLVAVARCWLHVVSARVLNQLRSALKTAKN